MKIFSRSTMGGVMAPVAALLLVVSTRAHLLQIDPLSLESISAAAVNREAVDADGGDATTCASATFDASTECLSGQIDDPNMECTECDPGECCEFVARQCEVLDISVLPIVNCDSAGHEVTISISAIEEGPPYENAGCVVYIYTRFSEILGANGMSPAMCFDHCNKDPYQAFGIYYTVCGCIPWVLYPDEFTFVGAVPCNIPCDGDSSATCGGGNPETPFVATVYEIVGSVQYTLEIFDESGASIGAAVDLPSGPANSGYPVTGLRLNNLYTIVVTGIDNGRISGSGTCQDVLDFTPVCVCDSDDDCDTDSGETCCLLKEICELPPGSGPGACGDPHMTGFRGQKFDFTGEDDGWYAILSDLPNIHLNMRITAPVPSVPEITYITGISIKTTDANNVDHTILISVTNPHSLDSSCPVGVSPCLAEGALSVELDGKPALVAPGEISLGPDVAISAVNLPGACRSFGFEKYWERKQAEMAEASRLLMGSESMQDMAEWILGDPTATNMDECIEYVTGATASLNGSGLFAHDSEHASFQIMTPVGKIRLSHGRLHQLPVRDPADRFDIPDHITWQMNLAIDHNDLSLDATGILGETLVPTLDGSGNPIMLGMESIRGSQEDYRVQGPLGTAFAQAYHRE